MGLLYLYDTLLKFIEREQLSYEIGRYRVSNMTSCVDIFAAYQYGISQLR
jgi:hypothetical protein